MQKFILEEDKKTGKLKLINIIDETENLKQNKLERQINNNGFTKQRNMRKIASIPISALIALGEKGLEIYRDDKKMREFLREHPEYLVVDGGV